MTDTKTLLNALKEAKATALDGYTHEPNDENHLCYQSLHELETVFGDIIAAAPAVQSIANQVHIPVTLLETWIHAIARNCLSIDDSSYIAAEEAIKRAALQTVTTEELAEAEARPRTPRLFGLELDPDDAVIAFLREPTEDNLHELNDWLKNLGKAAAWEATQQDNPPLIAQRQRYG